MSKQTSYASKLLTTQRRVFLDADRTKPVEIVKRRSSKLVSGAIQTILTFEDGRRVKITYQDMEG